MIRLPPLCAALLLAACSSDAPPPAQASVAPAGKAGMCAACHGQQGISPLPAHPHLAGQNREYLVSAMQQYKRSERKHAAMQAVMGPLSEQDIENLATHYSQLPGPTGAPSAP